MKYSFRIRAELLNVFAILTLSTCLIFPAFGAEKGVTRYTYDTLKQVEQFQNTGKYHKAIKILQQQANGLNDKGYDKAVILQYLAYAYNTAGKTKLAHNTARKALSTINNFPKVKQSLLYLLAQTSFETEAFEQGTAYIQSWLKDASEPSAEGLFLAGFGNFRLKRYRSAERYLKQAISAKVNAPIGWYQILLAVYVEQKHYRAAVPIAEQLIARKPSDEKLWQTLSSLYFQQNDNNKALASLILAKYTSEPSPEQIKQIVGLSVSLGMPDHAARMLNNFLEKGRLQKSYDNLKLLYQCWSLARETDKAKKVLAQAAKMATTGEDYLLLGHLHFEQQEWKKAQIALNKALQKGHLKHTKQAKLFLGICACHTGETKKAKKYLNELLSDSKYKKVAAYWLSNLEKS